MENVLQPTLINRWNAQITAAKSVVIVTHAYADGDAIGALTGLGNYLMHMGLEASLVCPNIFPSFLNFLDKEHQIIIYQQDKEKVAEKVAKASLLIAVDMNSHQRMDELGQFLLKKNVYKILFDHHLDPCLEQFDLVFSSPHVSSACELIYAVLDTWKQMRHEPLDLPLSSATSLLTGIITDSNQFANSVFPHTYATANSLLAYGVDNNNIINQLFGTYSEDRMHLLGYALQKMVIRHDLHTGYIILSKAEMERFHFKPGDTEGFVNLPLSVKGITSSALFLEKDDHIKVSLRSKGNIPVNQLAASTYHGGGHLNASAGKISRPLEEMEEIYLKALGTIIV